jgi:chromosome segregation ATPase
VFYFIYVRKLLIYCIYLYCPVYHQYASHITEENEKQKEEIDALNGEIKDLTTELVTKKSRRTKGKDADLASELESLEEEIGKVREKLSREQTETSKLKEKLADCMALKTQAVTAKAESDAKVREQTKRIDDLEKELLKAMSVTKNAELQTKESNKVKGDTVKETKRLLEENEQMQNEVLYLGAFMTSER